MAYVVKKRCVLCHKVIDAEGRSLILTSWATGGRWWL